ncbi:alpha-ketoglutarate decarboxylase [Cryobacterium melibiosiphilum]|uniref:Alpha-ketoglutarate decarboxylase n=1 Tax=Cryobacterium melibiosiphilum TaxID=995039 RepID=A0A3A5MEA7_9MICO|nr:zf-HC2 domain-containing protein [Cryobacterium melibiosiphilum]RJT87465.1 alpha-ketoglutarate decarboxylase [Cryobacterium melibiosiphilum]
MTDCGCTKAQAELEEYLHHELCGADAADIQAHLAGCEDCASEHLVGRTLTEAVQRACKETAPEDLRDQVLARLRALQSAH